MSNSIIETYSGGFERLTSRFDAVEVATPNKATTQAVAVSDLDIKTDEAGFLDISAPAAHLTPFIGRVVLYPNRKTDEYNPAILTRKGGSLQLTILEQPFSLKEGITDGIMFGLDLKNQTRQATFGAHTQAGGFEAGHLAPVFIGTKIDQIGKNIAQHGDTATHAVGTKLGGVPEALVQAKLVDIPQPITRLLNTNNPNPIPLRWHPNLETDDGLMLVEFKGQNSAIELALGAAFNAIGDDASPKIESLANKAVVGG